MTTPTEADKALARQILNHHKEGYVHPSDIVDVAEDVAAHVAKAVAEAVGPLERDSGFLKCDLSEAESDADRLREENRALREALTTIADGIDEDDTGLTLRTVQRYARKALAPAAPANGGARL